MQRDDWQRVHTTVLLEEVLAALGPISGGLYVDGTLGIGGHAEAILQHSAPNGRLVGFEWDEQAAALATERLQQFGQRFVLVPGSYADSAALLQQVGVSRVDGMIIDLGVSSLQLDQTERGFSFRRDAALDMRMDRRRGKTAAQLVATLSEQELADIFFHYGEERQARRIAAHLVQERQKEPVVTTGKLAEIVAAAIPKKFHPKKIHVATKVFQALRIAVNRELDNLVRLLDDAPQFLVQGARICIITFHSLEDRIVKRAFQENPKYMPFSGRPTQATQREIINNPRARSAKLRVAEVRG
jgi:16S rRNA (cytosine1402-N4)-methyltransferase